MSPGRTRKSRRTIWTSRRCGGSRAPIRAQLTGDLAEPKRARSIGPEEVRRRARRRRRRRARRRPQSPALPHRPPAPSQLNPPQEWVTADSKSGRKQGRPGVSVPRPRSAASLAAPGPARLRSVEGGGRVHPDEPPLALPLLEDEYRAALKMVQYMERLSLQRGDPLVRQAREPPATPRCPSPAASFWRVLTPSLPPCAGRDERASLLHHSHRRHGRLRPERPRREADRRCPPRRLRVPR